jgi:hypothetical protein
MRYVAVNCCSPAIVNQRATSHSVNGHGVLR